MPRSLKRWFGASTVLALTTAIATLLIAYLANGSVLTTVSMSNLRLYGGTTFEDIGRFELWRIISAQLIHAKLPHMLLNALGLFLLGNAIEPAIGGQRVFLVWLVGGGIATVISPLFIEVPWNVGTGASQATFAFAGCAAVLAVAGKVRPILTWALIAFVVLPGLALDLIFAGYPKPGHIIGLLLGAMIGFINLRRRRKGFTPD